MNIGDPVHDSATLTGATADAGGTVTYTVYTDNTCTENPRDAGTKTVTGGIVPDSNTLSYDHAGTSPIQLAHTTAAGCTPKTFTFPPSGWVRPSIMSIFVVLPTPFGPRRATVSPGAIVRSIERTAHTAP